MRAVRFGRCGFGSGAVCEDVASALEITVLWNVRLVEELDRGRGAEDWGEADGARAMGKDARSERRVRRMECPCQIREILSEDV